MDVIKKTFLSLILLAELLFVSNSLAADKITIGILAFRPKPIVEARWQPLINYLNQKIGGAEFEFSALNYTELEDAISHKQIDFVFTNSSHFVQLAHKTDLSSPLATLINKKSGKEVRSFAGTILVKIDSKIKTLADLSGTRIATPSVKSFGGYKMQAYELYESGVMLPNDAEIIETTMPHDKAIDALLKGKADAAFIRSGVLESLEKQGKVNPGDVRVLNLQKQNKFPFEASTRLYPEWPFAAMPHVGEELAGKVAAALLSLPQNSDIANAIKIHGFRIPADYEPIREVLRTLRVYPFDQSPEIRLSDLWQQRKIEVLSILLLISVIAALGLYIFRINHKLVDSHTKLKANNASLKIAAVAFNTQQAIMITDDHENIIQVNNAFTRITGYSASDVIGKTPRLFKSGKHDQEFYKSFWQSLNEHGYWQGEVWNRRKDQEVYPVGQTVTAIRDEKGNITHYLSTFDDITVFKKNEERIEKLAFYDPLTKLANRRLLIDHLSLAKAHSTRSKQHFALLFIDLDHFKNLNDTLGHNEGDQLLLQVSQRLVEAVRDGDTVARLGGDEFLILVQELNEDDLVAGQQAKNIAEKILKTLNIPYKLKNQEFTISASIGISLYQDHHESIDEMMIRSDLAMYQAKSAGRNTYRFFNPGMQEEIKNRIELENELRTALENEEFRLFYQPKVDPNGCILGYEALIRWQHPTKGLLLPGSFIEISEESGIIKEIGQWVVLKACQKLAIWQSSEKTKHLSIAVNISEQQLNQEHFVETIYKEVGASSCDPKSLQLEITESMLMTNIEESISKITQLKNLGITFAIDDFETGYSSLNYLKKLPIDSVKIDRSFINEMLTDSHDNAIVNSVIALSKTLGLTAIAEGVETPEQKEYLIELGCSVLQGFLFDKPKPVAELGLQE